MGKYKILDLSKISPEKRVNKLLTTIDGMSNNEVIIVETDFDFKPLHCLMVRKSGLGVEYLEIGPQRWKIKLMKSDTLDHLRMNRSKINECGSESELVKKFSNIYESLKGADTSQGINHIKEIWLNSNVSSSLLSHNHWSISYMIHFIINSIHANIIQLFAEINFYSGRLNLAFKTKSHAIIDLAELLNDLENILINHLQKEEGILFPIFIKMDNIEMYPSIKSKDTIIHSIKMMENEHELIQGIIDELKDLFHQYSASQVTGESNTYMLSYLLDILEKEIHFLIELEDRILYPKAKKLELKINAQNS